MKSVVVGQELKALYKQYYDMAHIYSMKVCQISSGRLHIAGTS